MRGRRAVEFGVRRLLSSLVLLLVLACSEHHLNLPEEPLPLDPVPPPVAEDFCTRVPVGVAWAFFQDGGIGLVRASVLSISLQPYFHSYWLLDEFGGRYRLIYQALEPMPLVREGGKYVFDVEFKAGWPNAGSILVSDEDGLLFAAASDTRPRENVLTRSLGEFTFTLGEPTCPTRPTDQCFEAIFNLPLEVSYGGQRVTLHHGDSAFLGRYRVRCLAAQKPVSSNRCPDAALVGVSFTIERIGL